MTIDADCCVVRIAVDSAVFRIRLRLVAVRAGMADDAGERRIVRRNDVAIGADRALVRNAEPGVVKGRPQPARGDPRCMAGYASRRVQCGNVIRHGAAERLRAQPGRLMASIAIRVRGSKAEWIGAHVA